jgi:serine/threonine-protein kinase RsbW
VFRYRAAASIVSTGRADALASGEHGPDVVRIIVPAALEYMRIVRLTASGIATRLGFDVDEIENLRVAVDELASTVADAASGGELEIRFASANGQLHIEGHVPLGTGREPALDALSAQILNAVSNEYELRVDNGVARFACVFKIPAG